MHKYFFLHEKNQNFLLHFNAPISPKFRAVKICAITEIRSQKIPLEGQEIAGSPGGEGCLPAPNSLLVAALGQLIANNVWTFLMTFSIKTRYRYSSNSISSWDTKVVYPINKIH